MIEYLYITLAAFMIAGQFTVNKVYQKKFDNPLFFILLPMFTGLTTLILFFILNRFSLQVNRFVLIITFINALVNNVYGIIGILAMKYGSVTLYTMVAMSGGMLIPYFYGIIFIGEPLSVFTVVGAVVLVTALIINAFSTPVKTEKSGLKFFIICCLVFILNGTSSLLGKIHQINAAALPTNDFIVWLSIFSVINCAIFLSVYVLYRKLKNKKAERTIRPKQIFHSAYVSFGHGVFYGAGLMLQLWAAIKLPASVQYPFITGGSVILSTVFAKIVFKEKLNLKNIISLILLMTGTVAFVF